MRDPPPALEIGVEGGWTGSRPAGLTLDDPEGFADE